MKDFNWFWFLVFLFISSVHLFSQTININKTSLSFNCIQNGVLPFSQNLIISNSGTGVLNWNITENIEWLDINPKTGKDSGSVALSINTSNNNAGVYSEIIFVSSPNATNSPLSIKIIYAILKRPAISISNSGFTFYAFQNGIHPNADSVRITNSGSGFLNWSAISNASWLTINPLQGVDTSLLRLTINSTNMNPGSYDAQITIISNEAQNSPQTIKVKYIINLPYQAVLNLNKNIDFPAYSNIGNYQSSNYKLIGLPGNSGLFIKDFFSGEQGIDWQAFRDNGEDTNYFFECSRNDDFKFSTGRGFWILKRGLMPVNTIINSAPINDKQKTEIPLHPGWNIITNPFLLSISWSRIQNINNIILPVWKYDGKFEESLSFNSFEGYYFDNKEKLKSLIIPYGEFFKRMNSENYDLPEIWKMDMRLINSGKDCGAVTLGIIQDSENIPDKYDFRKPRDINNIPSIYFDRSKWDKSYKYLAADFRPPFNESESWDFTIDNLKRNSINALKSTGIENIPLSFKIILTDLENEITVDLRKYPVYYFHTIKKDLKFILTIGKNNIDNNMIKYSHPNEFNIDNYPNPFNLSTCFLVDIAEPVVINLSIFDRLGRKVKTIYSGSLNSGKYKFLWDGRDENGRLVSTGIYFYRMYGNAGSSLSRRLIFLK